MTEQHINLIPKRRFIEFKNSLAWETRKLDSIFKKIRNAFVGTATPYYVNSGNFYLQSNNVKNGQINRSTEIFINDKFYEKQKDKWLHAGDLVMVQSGHVGHTAVITEEFDETAAHALIMFQEYKDQADPYFLNFQFQTKEAKRKLESITTGNTIKHILASEMKEFEVSIPQIEEQKKIGKFLKILDHTIVLQERKLEKTKALKSAYLSEMFPIEGECKPKRRFAGFTQAWDQHKWVNMVDISTNMVDPKSGKYDKLLHVGPGNIESFSGRIYDNVKTVKEDNLISGKFHFNKGDIIYGKINPQLGKYIFAPFEGLASADTYVLNTKNGLDQTFLFALLQTRRFYKYSVSVSMRSGMPKINRDELNAYEFKAPSLHEQKRIGEFFLQLDHLITLHQRKLKKLQNLKKAYLNEMFV
ncbi:restriction endonuclease subunit S [Fictibacillus sp. 26RED30]|uniref:restriction endonuclease subunit S n=1 Tax=Fictibacillus sp. 26RED30 TaxID=2745877 RepID=UPI00351C35B3